MPRLVKQMAALAVAAAIVLPAKDVLSAAMSFSSATLREAVPEAMPVHDRGHGWVVGFPTGAVTGPRYYDGYGYYGPPHTYGPPYYYAPYDYAPRRYGVPVHRVHPACAGVSLSAKC